jgi:hypothetical protein
MHGAVQQLLGMTAVVRGGQQQHSNGAVMLPTQTTQCTDAVAAPGKGLLSQMRAAHACAALASAGSTAADAPACSCA